MTNIAIFCVTYNSYNELAAFLSSLENAAVDIADKCVVDVYITDNTENNRRPVSFQSGIVNIRTFYPSKNLGYFGGVKYAMDSVDVSPYHFVAISNVDLEFRRDALCNLLNLEEGEDVGWIAVQLYSLLEGRDRNPSVLKRYSRKKLQLLRIMFKYPLFMWLYKNTFYCRKKYSSHYQCSEIYAGHGSFILLTDKYFSLCGKVDYPVFLYGEELYIAEQCRKHGLKVKYNPSVCLIDKEHVSTGKMRKVFYYKCNYEGLTYILNTFYKD